MKIWPKIGKRNIGEKKGQLTLNSNAAMPIPEAAPVPAKPMKCPDPILLANKEAPTCEMADLLLM